MNTQALNTQALNTQARLATLDRIRRFSRLMDTAFRIPGTPFRFGWDPIIGLIPGLGDVIDTVFSAYIIFLAAQFGLPKGVLGWMVFNISLEAIVGSVPVVGDAFDAYYKSNIRNLALLEQHLQATEPELESAALAIAEPAQLPNPPARIPATTPY